MICILMVSYFEKKNGSSEEKIRDGRAYQSREEQGRRLYLIGLKILQIIIADQT